MPRLLFLNRSYYPDAEATGQLLTQLCEHLADDFDVTVVPGQPYQNPKNIAFTKWGAEEHNGVTIQRVWNTRLPKRSILGKAINLLSYLVLATWTTLTQRAKPDVIVVETDPPLLCLLGAIARWRYGCKLVVYLQDIYPDLAIALGKLPNNTITRWLHNRFLATYKKADRVIVLSRDMRDVLIESGVPQEKVTVIPNWTDTDRITPRKTNNQFRSRHGLNGAFVVMYSGNMGLCQGLENVLGAAEQLRHREDIVFVLIGDGALRHQLQSTAAKKDLHNVRFLDYQPFDQLSDSLSAADIHLVPLDARVSRYLMPSKLYGILASGTPLIAIAQSTTELAQIVLDNELGYVVAPNDPAALGQQLEALSNHPGHLTELGHRARALAESTYSRQMCVTQFTDQLNNILVRENPKAQIRNPKLAEPCRVA